MRLLEKWFCVLGFCCFVVSERWIFVYNEYYPPPQRSDSRFMLFQMSVQSELFSSAPLMLLLVLRRRYAFRLLEYL